MKVFIEDNKIIKTIMDAYVGKEFEPEADEVLTVADSTDHMVYEGWELKLYKDSQAILDRKAELEDKGELNEYEEQELEYINELLA